MTHILITDLREIGYMASNGESLPFDRVEDRIKIIGLISSTIRIPCSLLDLEPDLYQVPVEVEVAYYLPWRNEFVTTKDCVFNKSEATKVVARIKSSSKENEESQEELWRELIDAYDLTDQSSYGYGSLIKKLSSLFTITRKRG